jgi:molybdate transport system substrate-binding protein
MKRALLALLVAPALAAGCSGSSNQPTPSGGPQKRTITVFAAASLTKAFTAEGKGFEQSHQGLTVTFSFAGSQALVAQIRQGAPASVLATADLASSVTVKDQLGTSPVVFAHNQLAIVTAPGNPKHLTGLADLAKPGLKVVLAGPTVPVGKAAAKALKAAHVTVKPVSLEDAVTGVVTKVRLGEADAGIAYVTDVAGATDVGGALIPGTTTELVISTLKGISAPDDADAFIGYVQSAEGQLILKSFGFT